jgi:hypothetical protein
MLKNILLLLLLCPFASATAQVGFANTFNGRVISVADINGQSLIGTQYKGNIEGTPFLTEQWLDVMVQLKNGAAIPAKVKLNIESNELYYMDSIKKIRIADDGLVKRIDFINAASDEKLKYPLKSGYPPADNLKANLFFQVLAEGKMELLCRNYKLIETFKNEASGEIRKEFIEKNKYYLYYGETLRAYNFQKEQVLQLMMDKEVEINDYLQANKINFKKIPDIQKLVAYYNRIK